MTSSKASESRHRPLAQSMRSTPIFNGDPERVIAIGRVVISTFALGAIYLDPTQPANLVKDAYGTLTAYVAFAALSLSLGANITRSKSYKRTVMAIDICVAGLLVYITDELESPFLTFFTFTIISAAIRWQWRGTLATAGVLQAILIIIGVPDLEDGDSELNQLIIRSAFCWANVLLLGYFGSYRDHSNKRLHELASWPHDLVLENDHPCLEASMRHASMVLGANGIAVLWTDRDERPCHAAIWGHGECCFIDLAGKEGASFTFPTTNSTEELGSSSTRLPCEVRDRLGATDQALRQAYVCGFATVRFRGCVIVVEPSFRDRDIILLTQIVAARIAMELEQFSLVRNYARAAGLKERERFAHDLHDSILQDLAAAVLQLDTNIRTGVHATPDLLRLRQTLQLNQCKLRDLVEGARATPSGGGKLDDILRLFVEPLSMQWGCKIALSVSPQALEVSDVVAAELCLALAEATANAARHGGACNLRVNVVGARGSLDVTIDDDGHCAIAELPQPASIIARVKALGGTLAVARRFPGLRLRIAVPLG